MSDRVRDGRQLMDPVDNLGAEKGDPRIGPVHRVRLSTRPRLTRSEVDPYVQRLTDGLRAIKAINRSYGETFR